MKKDFYLQTGDLLYFTLGYPNLEVPTATEIPKEAKKRDGTQVHKTDGGNSHGFRGNAVVLEHNGATFIDAAEDIVLTHPEHKDLRMPAGKYEIRHVREKDHFSDLVRPVVD